MPKRALIAALLVLAGLPAIAARELEGHTTLKDLRPYDIKDREHKHTAYDILFAAEGRSYTCRTDPKKSVNATDFIVGSDILYQIKGQKVKIKTPEKKELECAIVRVEEGR
jgi:hypothetical protein